MKKSISLLLALMLLALGCSTAFARSAEDDYEKALALLAEEKYQDAVKAFDELDSYLDAPRYSMYSSAMQYAQNGLYAIAVQNFTSLGDFMDSPLLAVYYTALACEETEEYETALQLLDEISLYKDSADRLLTYPEKINARDYKKAVAAQEASDLDAALSLFKKLGNYQDSASRLKEVEQLVQRYAAEMGSLSESGEIVVTDELRYHVEQVLVKCDGDLEAAATLLGL